MSWKRRVLVVEDEPFVASLLCEVLAKSGFDAVSAGDAATARDLAEAFDPDAALIDINLGSGACGLQLGCALHRVMPHIALVFLSQFYDPRLTTRNSTLVPPGSAFLAKDTLADAGALVECIESTLRPGSALRWDDVRAEHTIASLSDAQLETLRLAALGYTNSAIAAYRGVSERAIERRLHEVYDVLGIAASPSINMRVEAVKRYQSEAGDPSDEYRSPS